MMAKLRSTPIHRERCITIRMDWFELSIQENSIKRSNKIEKKKHPKKKQNKV